MTRFNIAHHLFTLLTCHNVSNSREDIRCALIRTRHGSHAAYVDGVFMERSWMMDVSIKFLRECHHTVAGTPPL